jgi:Zn-dependent protease with chaperone function
MKSGKLKIFVVLLATAEVFLPNLISSLSEPNATVVEKNDGAQIATSSNEDNCWLTLKSEFAAIKAELAAFTPKREATFALPPKTEAFLAHCFSICCNAAHCNERIDILLDCFNEDKYDTSAFISFDKKNKMIIIRKDYLQTLISATELETVRENYFQFMCSLAHELGHLNDPDFLNSTNYDFFIDQHGDKICTALSLIAICLSIGSYLIDNTHISQSRNVAIGASAVAFLLKLVNLHTRRRCEFTADEFMLKTWNYDIEIPKIWAHELFQGNQNYKHSKRFTGKIRDFIFDSKVNGFLNFLVDHPTNDARVQHLRDLIKKHQAALAGRA